MKRSGTAAALLIVTVLSGTTHAESEKVFRPQTGVLLGTNQAGDMSPFTHVITQLAGEPAVSVLDELFLNLVPNWPRLARAFLTQRKPVVAYTTIAWGDDIVRITCWVDRAKSELSRGQLWVVMEATEGTKGSVPIGTIFSTADSRLIVRRGKVGLVSRTWWTPGLVPDVLPTPLTLTTQVVPGFWKIGRPGQVYGEFTFTSVEPADGSPPQVYTSNVSIPIE